MATETMHISLPDTLRRYVEERVQTGHYGNTSEYIRELIRRDLADQQQRQREALEQKLLEAVDSLERGEGREATPEYWKDLRLQAQQRLADLRRPEDTA